MEFVKKWQKSWKVMDLSNTDFDYQIHTHQLVCFAVFSLICRYTHDLVMEKSCNFIVL